ncbi:MAG: VOC family protein [Bacteroidota bacterium]
MLATIDIFSSFSTNKLLESFHFYHEVLGLDAKLKSDRFLHIYSPSGQPIVIYQKEDHVPSRSTVLNFQIDNILEKVKFLQKQGICFLQYDPPIQTDSHGISWDEDGSHLAWFKDPGQNILALIEN